MLIRDAVEADLPAITAIYNSVLLSSTAIYNDTPATLDDRLAWFRQRLDRSFPVLVAEEANQVLGYASFGDFRPWPGYRFTVEGTIHIAESARAQGLGTALLAELLQRAQRLGMHTLVAGVDSENLASLRFLERSGFTRAGELPEVGYKFGRFLNLVFLTRPIDPTH